MRANGGLAGYPPSTPSTGRTSCTTPSCRPRSRPRRCGTRRSGTSRRTDIYPLMTYLESFYGGVLISFFFFLGSRRDMMLWRQGPRLASWAYLVWLLDGMGVGGVLRSYIQGEEGERGSGGAGDWSVEMECCVLFSDQWIPNRWTVRAQMRYSFGWIWRKCVVWHRVSSRRNDVNTMVQTHIHTNYNILYTYI